MPVDCRCCVFSIRQARLPCGAVAASGRLADAEDGITYMPSVVSFPQADGNKNLASATAAAQEGTA